MHLAGQKMTFKIRQGRPKSLGHLIFFDHTIIVCTTVRPSKDQSISQGHFGSPLKLTDQN